MTTDRLAGIVLCGGQSRRMGASKADLVMDGETLLARTIRIVRSVADPVIVAAAPEQVLPSLPVAVQVVRDSQPHRGPLHAFVEALDRLSDHIEWTYLVGCDMPFLTGELLRSLANQPRNADAIVPFIEARWHPLAGLYRRSTKLIAERLLNDGRPRMLDLLDSIRVMPVVDLDARCLCNVNTPEEFAGALRERP